MSLLLLFNAGETYELTANGITLAAHVLPSPALTPVYEFEADGIDLTGHEVGFYSQNYLQRSEEFDNAYWTKSNTTINPNAAANPLDGAATADEITFNGIANAHIRRLLTSMPPDTPFTASIWIQKVSGSPTDTQSQLTLHGAGIPTTSNFIGSDVDGTWQRFSVSATTNSVGGDVNVNLRCDVAAVYNIFGAQLNYGSTVMPYVKTEGSAILLSGPPLSQVHAIGILGGTSGTNLWDGGTASGTPGFATYDADRDAWTVVRNAGGVGSVNGPLLTAGVSYQLILYAYPDGGEINHWVDVRLPSGTGSVVTIGTVNPIGTAKLVVVTLRPGSSNSVVNLTNPNVTFSWSFKVLGLFEIASLEALTIGPHVLDTPTLTQVQYLTATEITFGPHQLDTPTLETFEPPFYDPMMFIISYH